MKLQKLSLLGVLGLPLLLLLPFLNSFFFTAGSQFTDMAITHYPNALTIQRGVTQKGEIPLWSDAILGGFPLTANPLSGLHYPPGWLALFFPLPAGLNLLVVLHLILGGVGVYQFLRGEGLSLVSSLFGAMAWEAMPRLWAHFGAGHLTLLYASGWIPWLLVAHRNAFQLRRRFPVFPGIVLGMVILVDPRMVPVAGLLWAGYGFMRAGRPFCAMSLIHQGLRGALNLVFAAGIGAVLMVPLAEFLPLSTRARMTLEDRLVMSLPPERLIGLVVPEMGGTPEWVVYVGTVVLSLGMIGIWSSRNRKNILLWGAGVALFTLLSLGEHLPGYAWLTQLPGLNLLRVPSRMLIAADFCWIVVASYGMEMLWVDQDFLRKLPKVNPLLGVLGLGCFILALIPPVWMFGKVFPLRLAWSALGFLVVFVWLAIGRSRASIKHRWWVFWMFIWMAIDLWGVDALSNYRLPAEMVVKEKATVAEAILQATCGGRPFRVYSPSYSLPQQTAAFYDLQLADGVDPLQLDAYSREMQQAGGYKNEGYSVTLPPFPNGEPATDQIHAKPDSRRLGLFNVCFLAAEFPLGGSGFQFVGKFHTAFLYKNLDVLPRSWVQSETANLGEGILSIPTIQSFGANRVVLDARGPGLLVLSEIYYPGWQVTVDGRSAEVIPVHGILRGVILPAGNHEVVFWFRPNSFFAGMAVSLVTLLATSILWLRRSFARQREIHQRESCA